jgi:hypothetical protein
MGKSASSLGPLFVAPAAHVSWLEILPLLIAIPALALLVLGLVRGRLPIALAGSAVLLPIAANALGGLFLLENSKKVSFCGSCHVMAPIEQSLKSDDGSLASVHYAHGRVPHEQACYTCHSGYGIWGGVGAKSAGLMHMVHTVTGNYDLPLRINGPFDIDSCLTCHADAKAFQEVEAHQNREIQEQLLSREISCTGLCHPAAHPESALTGGMPAS